MGLYAPGGKAVYPTSVIMNAVPAQVAGVGVLAVATPPNVGNNGLPDKTILATCAILDVEEVYAVGGAQAVAMFAYGANGSEAQDGEALCDPVDKITGLGNVFVATAKSLVSGMVGIDAVAGPTEIAILAVKIANPDWVAADLIGQAEHDELAGSVLITDSEELGANGSDGIMLQLFQAFGGLGVRRSVPRPRIPCTRNMRATRLPNGSRCRVERTSLLTLARCCKALNVNIRQSSC